MGKHLIRFLGLMVVTGAIVSTILVVRQGSANKDNAPVPIFAATVTPSPSNVTDVLAPNGKNTLTMKVKKAEGSVVYTFFISGGEEGSKEIFSKSLAMGDNLSIPFNTFSPDNKYVFLKETTSGKVNYFVLPVSGGEAIDASGPFAERFSSDFEITDVTGWGGLNLLVINTNKLDGEKGPSFWFDVPSRSFIRLSHSF